MSDLAVTTMESRRDRIAIYHEQCIASMEQGHMSAFLCGLELNQAKGALPHGKFTEWREKALPFISPTRATRYMRFADSLLAQRAVNTVVEDQKLLIGGAADEQTKEAVHAAVYEVMDGKGMVTFMRDLGVIKAPTAKSYHPPKLSAKEAKEAESKGAEDFVRMLIGNLRTALKNHTLALVSDALRKELNSARLDLGRFLSDVSQKQSGGTKRKPKK